jgi:ATP-dependent helicase YprA (DUF1998 family)
MKSIVFDHATEIISAQKNNLLTFPWVDEITKTLVSDVILGLDKDWREAGIAAVLYPKDFSKFREDRQNITVPYFHKIEFRITGTTQTELEIRMNALRPEYEYEIVGGRARIGARKISNIEKIDGWEKQDVPLKVTLGKLLKKPINGTIVFPQRIQKIKVNETTYIKKEYKKIILSYEINGRQVQNTYEVTIKIENTTPQPKKMGNGEEEKKWPTGILFSLYGVALKVKINNGRIEPYEVAPKVTTSGKSVNTSVVKSNNSETLFSSPIIIHDVAKRIPTKGPKIEEIISKEGLKKNLYSMSPQEIENLEKLGYIELVAKIFQAISKLKDWNIKRGKDKIDYLYKWQFDAIQLFLKQMLTDSRQPTIYRAPTGTGKTLVFVFCCIFVSSLNNEPGAKVILTYPTRALSFQQLNEFIEILYHMNKFGRKFRVGLFMGRGTTERGVLTEVSAKSIHAGDILHEIEHCPNCGSTPIIAKKPSEDIVIPYCNKCGLDLDFVSLDSQHVKNQPPDIVIATIDKMSYDMSQDVYSHTLWGMPAFLCQNCGRWILDAFESIRNNPVCWACNAKLNIEKKVQSKIQLVVFDEVHTLVGTTGNLMSHFLSLLDQLRMIYDVDNKPIRIIGATATIANQNELIRNLTKQDPLTFPRNEEYKDYFPQSNELHYRFVVLEPVNRSTRDIVTRANLAIYNFINSIRMTGGRTSNVLKRLKKNFPNSQIQYQTQVTFVRRKQDGGALEKGIEDLGNISGNRVTFVHGDLSRKQLGYELKKIEDLERDIVITTVILGLGMDIEGLNVLHFFGMPSSFVELAQIVGRTGRREFPALVFVYVFPQQPRDNFIYEFFREIMTDLSAHYEPAPINRLNRHAVLLSIYNIIHALMIAERYKTPSIRRVREAYDHFKQRKNLDELIKRIKLIYAVPDVEKKYGKYWEELQQEIKTAVLHLLDILSKSDGSSNVNVILKSKKLLVDSLRGREEDVIYTPSIRYPHLENIQFSEQFEDLALFEQEALEETVGR